ncbi:MAG: DHHW family protein [Lachnospiraceae bacterium]|nr:DHHW family protein [Lachnospiraceae bacterium]
MKYKIQVILIATFFLALSVYAWVKPADKISDSELRNLAQFPEVNKEKLLDGSFMSDFESYTLDQFPLREEFRTVKAITSLYVFRQLDNNGIYIEDGYAVKMEYPLNTGNVSYAIGRMQNVYDKFIAGTDAKCYISVIPDKNYFLADEHGALALDYETLFETVQHEAGFAQYIDITDLLNIEDFYCTDTHWNQVHIADVADRLAFGMGAETDNDYTINTVNVPFYGVYYGQAALPMKPDTMQYLTNDAIEAAVVTDNQNGVPMSVYDESKMSTRAPYDLFLGGSLSMITIENPMAATDKELIVFRDSFGSSLVPLLISGYKKITVFDIRYLPGDRIGYFTEFTDQDVLFIYSTSVLNNGNSIK